MGPAEQDCSRSWMWCLHSDLLQTLERGQRWPLACTPQRIKRGILQRPWGHQMVRLLWQLENLRSPQGLEGLAKGTRLGVWGLLGCFSIAFGCWADNAVPCVFWGGDLRFEEQ